VTQPPPGAAPVGLPLREALELTGIGAVACDGAGRITMISPALRELFRLNSETYGERELARRFGLRRPDGSRMPAAETPLVRAAAGEYVKNVVIGLQDAEGQLRWLECNGAPIGDGEGAWVLTQDVTAHRRTEALQEELRGRLERTVGHDFSGPLADLLRSLEVVRAQPEVAGDLARSLAAIERSANRLEELVAAVAQLVEKQEELHRAGRTPDGAPRRVV